MASVAPQMASSLEAGLKPLTQIANVVQQQLNIIGGIVETLAAKIESSMKFTGMQTALTNVQARFQALSPAAARAVGIFKGFLAVRSTFNNLRSSTDQTRLSLTKLNGLNLAAPTAGASRMANEFRTMAPAVNKVTAEVKGLGLQIGMALGVVGLVYKGTQALVGFFSAGIKGAIDLNETMNVTNVTFEKNASIVTETAADLSSKYGLAKGTLLDAANAYGSIFQGAKMSERASAELASEMVRLAADVTSFKHIGLDESLDKIKSALTGESKPLKDLGVAINENMIKQRAHTLGLKQGKQELSEFAKSTAIASLISDKFTKASGDLERTQDVAANQFLRAGGGLTNFGTTIGTMLLPTVKVAITAFNDLLATVVSVFEANKPLIQTWADTIKGAFETAAMVLRNAGDYWTIFKLTTIENLSNVLAYVETIPANLGVMAEYIQTNWKDMIFTGVDAVLTIFINLGKNIRELATQVWEFMKNPAGGFTFNWTPLLQGFQSTVKTLPQLVKPELISMQDEIAAAGQRIFDREKQRAESIAKIAPPVAKGPVISDEEKKKGTKYVGTAAAEMGSTEAASSIARFYNQSGNDAKQTAQNTKEIAKTNKGILRALVDEKTRSLQQQGLYGFPI